MEFYAIAKNDNRFILVDEGEGIPEELSSEQLAVIVDR